MGEPTYEISAKGARMDYREHEATYSLFLLLVKWGIAFNAALLAALAVGFFMGGGFIGGLLVFALIMALAKIFT